MAQTATTSLLEMATILARTRVTDLAGSLVDHCSISVRGQSLWRAEEPASWLRGVVKSFSETSSKAFNFVDTSFFWGAPHDFRLLRHRRQMFPTVGSVLTVVGPFDFRSYAHFDRWKI